MSALRQVKITTLFSFMLVYRAHLDKHKTLLPRCRREKTLEGFTEDFFGACECCDTLMCTTLGNKHTSFPNLKCYFNLKPRISETHCFF